MERTIKLDRQRFGAMIELRGYDKKQLADLCGLHEQAIYKILRDEVTSFGTLTKLCGALRCHPFDLIVAVGYPEPFLAAPASL